MKHLTLYHNTDFYFLPDGEEWPVKPEGYDLLKIMDGCECNLCVSLRAYNIAVESALKRSVKFENQNKIHILVELNRPEIEFTPADNTVYSFNWNGRIEIETISPNDTSEHPCNCQSCTCRITVARLVEPEKEEPCQKCRTTDYKSCHSMYCPMREEVTPHKETIGEDTQEDLWDEVGVIVYREKSFKFYDHVIKELESKFKITRIS